MVALLEQQYFCYFVFLYFSILLMGCAIMTQLRWYVSRSVRARRQYDDNSVSTIVSTMGTDRSGNSYSATAIPWGVLMWGTLWKPIFCWNPWSYLAFGGHTVNCTLCCHTGTEEKGQKSAVEGVGHNGTIWNTQWRKVRHSIVEGEGGDTTEPFEHTQWRQVKHCTQSTQCTVLQ